ncbi:MAG: PQQ-dependent sugar dehydrogenase [Planctomycetia bacterium]|nr:PQQ-dependent sugar dehydrogenase [Planctomycetia bacterium]
MRLFRRATEARDSHSTSHSHLRVEQLEDRLTPVTLPTGFTESVFASGLTQPTAMVVAPDGRIFVAEKEGALRVVQNQTVLPTPFLSVTVDDFSERGLVGVTLDPNFQSNGFVYVYYTVPGTNPFNRVSRFTASTTNPNVAAAGSERILVDNLPSTNGNHNGGALVFRPDGMLYVAVGEAGVPANSQTLNNLLGKILRVNPATGAAAAGNPTTIAGLGTVPAGSERIWAAGLRNPFTMAVQPGTGRLFINDVGGGKFEEVNEGIAGANYGWPDTEGDFNQQSFPNFTRPIYAYAHGQGPLQGNTIAGGAFYNPSVAMFPAEYTGDYFFGEFINGRIYLRDNSTGVVTTFADDLTGGSPVDLDLGLSGQLLYLDIGSGTIYQITFGVSGPVAPGTQLTAVGTGPGVASQVRAFNPDGSIRFTASAYAGYSGGVRVGTGDVTGDGVEDVITGTGPGAPPHVKVFDGATGGLVRSFYAYDPGFLGGLFVSAGDVTGDGRADIVVGTARGAAHVKAFDGVTGAEVRSFIAYAGFGGGVTVAAGDVDGDNRADIITGSAIGPAHVKAFSGVNGAEVRSFFAFPPGYLGGVSVGFAGGGIVAGAAVGPPHVKVFNADLSERLSFFAFPATFPGGVRVAESGNTLLVGVGPGAGPHLKVFDALSGALTGSFFAFDPSTPGGIFVG